MEIDKPVDELCIFHLNIQNVLHQVIGILYVPGLKVQQVEVSRGRVQYPWSTPLFSFVFFFLFFFAGSFHGGVVNFNS